MIKVLNIVPIACFFSNGNYCDVYDVNTFPDTQSCGRFSQTNEESDVDNREQGENQVEKMLSGLELGLNMKFPKTEEQDDKEPTNTAELAAISEPRIPNNSNKKPQPISTNSRSKNTHNNHTDSDKSCLIWMVALIAIIAVIIFQFSHNDNYSETTQSGTEQPYTPSEGSNTSLPVHKEKVNQLKTESKPYAKWYGEGSTGKNYLSFNTSGDVDYIVIVKDYNTHKVINHIYICGGDQATIYLPNGTYSVYFYSGRDWNPEKDKGNVVGGFNENESLQKNEPIELYNQYGKYTLYPVQNGNLKLDPANEGEAF